MNFQIVDINQSGVKQEVTLDDRIFAVPYNEALTHQVVTAIQAGARSGSQKNKSRAEVKGSGRKPWRQKGTGNARAGSKQSPIWRSGGVTFAARPRDWTQKVNRKMYRGAMRSILSELLRTDRLWIVPPIALSSPKTKELQQKLAANDLEDVLIITEELDDNLYLSSRNLPKVGITDADHMDPVSLVGFGKTLITLSAIKQIEERLL